MENFALNLNTVATLILVGTLAGAGYLLWRGYSLSLYRPD